MSQRNLYYLVVYNVNNEELTAFVVSEKHKKAFTEVLDSLDDEEVLLKQDFKIRYVAQGIRERSCGIYSFKIKSFKKLSNKELEVVTESGKTVKLKLDRIDTSFS